MQAFLSCIYNIMYINSSCIAVIGQSPGKICPVFSDNASENHALIGVDKSRPHINGQFFVENMDTELFSVSHVVRPCDRDLESEIMCDFIFVRMLRAITSRGEFLIHYLPAGSTHPGELYLEISEIPNSITVPLSYCKWNKINCNNSLYYDWFELTNEICQ